MSDDYFLKKRPLDSDGGSPVDHYRQRQLRHRSQSAARSPHDTPAAPFDSAVEAPFGCASDPPYDYASDLIALASSTTSGTAVEPAGRVPSLERIADPENLLRAFQRLRETGGPAPGIDKLVFENVSTTEMGNVLRQVSRAIMGRTYKPYPTRSVRRPKPSGGFRELRIGTMCDRVVAAAVADGLSSTVDRQLLPGCFGFRRGRSVLDLLASVERTMIEQDRYVIITDDIRNAFPSVRIADAVDDYRQIIDDDGVIWLLDTLLHGHEGQSRSVGLDQGMAISPMTLNLRLSVCLDRPFTADPDNPSWYRWADNLIYLCHDVADADRTIQKVAQELRANGFELKGEEGPAIDLCQPGTCKQILGFEVGWNEGSMVLSVPGKAWTNLREGLEEAHRSDMPNLVAEHAVRGWVGFYGLAFGGAELDRNVLQVIRTAADVGFREIGSQIDWLQLIGQSEGLWQGARRHAACGRS